MRTVLYSMAGKCEEEAEKGEGGRHRGANKEEEEEATHGRGIQCHFG